MSNAFFTCYLNLIKATIGMGLVFYPIYFCKLGVIPTSIGIFLSSLFSQIGLYILCYVNNKRGPKSMAGLSKLYENNTVRHLCDVIVISKTLLVSISYFKNLDSYLCNIFSSKHNILLMLITSVVLFPLTSLKKIKSLKFASLIAVSATLYLILLLFFKLCFLKSSNTIPKIQNKFSLSAFLKQVPFFVFSFTAHHTIITIQNDFYNKSLNFFLTVIISASSSVAIIYFSFGVYFNKLYDLTSLNYDKDCLNVFPDGVEYLIARIGYILLIFFSIPLQLIPCRNHLIDMFSRKRRKENRIRYIYSLYILLFVFVIYCLKFNLSFFQRATGGTSSTILCFFIPIILLRKVYEAPWGLKLAGYLSVIYGVFVFTLFVWFIKE